MNPTVFFITGTSGSGKTTLVNNLKNELNFAKVHNFDERGVPENADDVWRKERTNSWLEKATEYKEI